MNIKTLYLTTTLPYVNAAPHIGHALEFFQADAYVRYFRRKLGKENVFFNVGTDEHGLKNYQKAIEQGKTPKQYVDEYAAKWDEFCKLFNISYDKFYRTSDPTHYATAQKFWETSLKNEDIYKKKYEGLYCVGCEEFKTEKELVDGKCPIHGTVPIQYSEENYFFKLSKYKDVLLNYFKDYPTSLKPDWKIGELENFIKNMEDISISRVKENLPWGIPVPGDETQVMYVWFDALTNYIAAIGYETDEKKFREWWDNNDPLHLTVQLFGPDNLRFQCAIWQGMLASVDIAFTKKFLCHGTILASDGTKMSKTKGNVVSPFDQQKKFGTDIIRYYMTAVLPTYSDSAYSESDLVYTYNSNLANNFGNLLNRVIHLANNKDVKINDYTNIEEEFKSSVDKQVAKIEAAFEGFDLKIAGELLNELSDIGNKYIDSQKPWAKENESTAEPVLNNLSYLLKHLIELYEPFIPASAEKASKALEKREKIILFEKIDESKIEVVETKLDPKMNSKVDEAKIAYKVFDVPKLDENKVNEYVDAELAELKKETLKQYLERKNIVGYDKLHANYHIESDTSCLALAKLAFNNKFPRINPLIDLYNVISLDSAIAFGLHDIEKIKGNVTLKVIEDDFEYIPLGSKEKIIATKATYSAVDDANGIICYAENRQTEKTKVTNKTKRALVYLQGNENISQKHLDDTLKLFLDKLHEFSQRAKSTKEIDVKKLLEPIIIGKILEINKHPNADKLQLVMLDLGAKDPKQVITGANNFKVGDLVPYLGENNVIPGYLIMNGEEIVLKKKNLRGMDSDSMILAEDEIGLSHDHVGIFIIQGDDSLIGKPLLDVLNADQFGMIDRNRK